MDELFVKGNKYISSKRASELTGYAKDYIGQLARGEKIPATRVGRSWYVDELALLAYGDFDKDEDFQAPASEEASRVVLEARPSSKGTAHVFSTVSHAFLNTPRNLPHTWSKVQYTSEVGDLIPVSKDTQGRTEGHIRDNKISDSQENNIKVNISESLVTSNKVDTFKKSVFFDLPPLQSIVTVKKEKQDARKNFRITHIRVPKLSPAVLYSICAFGTFILLAGVISSGFFISSDLSLSTENNLYTASISLSDLHAGEALQSMPFIQSGVGGLNDFYNLIRGSSGELFIKGFKFIENLINLV